LALEGGVRDQGGDLRAIVDNPDYKPLAKLTRNQGYKPRFPEERFKKLINENGLSLEDAAERAQEQGYFPEKPDRYANEVDPHEFLAAIEEDLRGNHRYSMHDDMQVAQFEEALARNHEVDQLAQEHGINPRGMSREQFFDTVAERKSVSDLADEVRAREADYEDHLAKGHDYLPAEYREGDILETEHGPMTVEPRTLEDLEREHHEATKATFGQGATPADLDRLQRAGGQEGLGETSPGQAGRAAGPPGGVGTETGGAGPPGAAAADTAGGGRPANRAGPTLGDFQLANLQRQLTQADYRMRDLAVQVADAYRRADELIAMHVGANAGGMLEEIAKAQHAHIDKLTQQSAHAALLNWQRPDLKGFAEREKAWRDTGVAPGIAQPELARDIADVKTAAANAKPMPERPKPPKDWGQPTAVERTERAGNPEKPAEKPPGEATPAGNAEAATTAPAKPETPTAAPTGSEKVIDLSGMGNGMTDSLYAGLYDALRQGKETFAGIKDPVLAKARSAFEQGLITSADDLRKLVQAGYDPKLASLQFEMKEHLTLEKAYPDLDTTRLLPEERAELEAAQAAVEQAGRMADAFEEAAACLKRAGA
jgi:hypothetical protein